MVVYLLRVLAPVTDASSHVTRMNEVKVFPLVRPIFLELSRIIRNILNLTRSYLLTSSSSNLTLVATQ